MATKKPSWKPADVLASVKKDGVKWIDLEFVDLLGGLQHIAVPADTVTTDDFRDGIGKLDGSSIKGFKEIHESDMEERYRSWL